MARRYLEKFTSLDGSSYSYTFPTARYEYDPTQALRSPKVSAVGVPYAIRLRGTGPAIKEVGRERVRCVYVGEPGDTDLEIDLARAHLYLGALGKLWLLDESGERRWAYAELSEMPQITISFDMPNVTAMVFGFERLSDWFGPDLVTVTETVTADAETWIVTNPGPYPVELMTIRLRANASGGITNPKLTNQANDFVFESSRDSSSVNDEIRLDTERPAVERSTNDGVDYTDDFASYVLADDQWPLSFRLEAGANTIRYNGGGTVNLDVTFSFYPVVG